MSSKARKFICATEEYATKAFPSLWKEQIRTPKTIPKTQNKNKIVISVKLKNTNTRSSPAPPNFSRSPAKIILPYVGASTCALGNHKCNTYRGNLTKNPTRKQIAISQE